MKKGKEEKEFDLSQVLGGTLNILGIKLDLGELLGAPEKLQGRLEELREKLKAAGGREVLSEDEWKRGGISVTGHIRTHGLLGEQEFHVGTLGRARGKAAGRQAVESPEVVEPPVDVFQEGEQVTIVADVPGVNLEELELKVQESLFSLSTREGARRCYRREVPLDGELDPGSLQASCRNGVLEVQLRRRGKATGSGHPGG